MILAETTVVLAGESIVDSQDGGRGADNTPYPFLHGAEEGTARQLLKQQLS